MTRKTYKTYRLKSLSIPFEINGKVIYVDFKGGCTASSTATYSTSNPAIQEALESLRSFGRDFYVERVVVLDEAEPKQEAPKAAQNTEKEEEKVVVDMLDAKTFKNLVELRNALQEKGLDVSQITNVKAAETLAKRNGYNYTIEKIA
jgi:hypothetical protein